MRAYRTCFPVKLSIALWTPNAFAKMTAPFKETDISKLI